MQREHDTTAMSELFSSYGDGLWRALVVVAGGRTDLAEDATAEAFSRLLANRRAVRDPQAWLYRVGLRIVVADLRRERRQEALGQLEQPSPHSVLSPTLTEALRKLSPDQRLAMFLAHHLDLTNEEIASRTGSSVAAVKMRLHRARKATRARLGEDTHD
jgi:RNA polymerase sigma-70 factor (ECF subfamily)